MHPLILKAFSSTDSMSPIIVDEITALEIVSRYSGIHVITLDECRTGMISGISLYEKGEDKKYLSVKDIRNWIIDMSEIPYEKKHLYILRDFDVATPDAMHASLKSLEEPPSYAIILLTVTNPESLLETIRSRAFTFFRPSIHSDLDEETRDALEAYEQHDETRLLRLLYTRKYEKQEAVSLLLYLAKNANSHQLNLIEEGIISLFNVNETPRNILDRIFFSYNQK